jgi:hypothetical protein
MAKTKIVYRYPGQKMIYGSISGSPVYLKEFQRISRILAVNSMIEGLVSNFATISSVLQNVNTSVALVSSIYQRSIQRSVAVNSVQKQKLTGSTDISTIYSKSVVPTLAGSTIVNKLQTNVVAINSYLINKIQKTLTISTDEQKKKSSLLSTSSISNKQISSILQVNSWVPYGGYSVLTIVSAHENQQKLSVNGEGQRYLGNINIRKPSDNSYLHLKTSKTTSASFGQYNGIRWDVAKLANSKGIVLKTTTQQDKDKIVNMLNNPNSPLYMLKSAGKPIVVIYNSTVYTF